MIRINLLPITEELKTQQGRTQLLLFAGVILAVLGVFVLLYFNKASELDKLNKQVIENQNKVKATKRLVADVGTLKKRAETLQKQLDVLNKLEMQRSGPVKVLDELQAILSPPRNADARFEQAKKNWNAEWDTRRLWLETLSEKGQAFEMTGAAVNADDVAEFLQRLTTSKHFQNIKLDYVEAKEKRVSQGRTARIVRYVTFRITGDLSYSGTKIVRVEDPKNSRRGKRN